MKLLQVILCAGLLARSHVIVSEHFLEVIPRSDGIIPQAEEPVVRRLVKHDGMIVCFDIFISAYGSHGDLV